MPLNNLYYPGSRPLPSSSLIAQERLVTVRLSWPFSINIKCIHDLLFVFFLFREWRFRTVASMSASRVSSSTVTGIWAHGIHTICIHVTVMGVGSALLQIYKNYIKKIKNEREIKQMILKRTILRIYHRSGLSAQDEPS